MNEPGAKGLDAGSRLGHGTQAAIPDELHQEVPKQMEGRVGPGPNQCGAHCRPVCHPTNALKSNNTRKLCEMMLML